MSFFTGNTGKIAIATLILVATILVLGVVYHLIAKKIARKTSGGGSLFSDFVARALRLPVFSFLVCILLRLYVDNVIDQTVIYPEISHTVNILLIFSFGWILVKLTRILFYFFEHRINLASENNYMARASLTKMKIFEGLVIGLIILIVISVSLMTFDKVRTLGVSLLTSAGIAGVILGFAAQKSLAMVLAGIQVAITQPIRLDDVVIVEGEWGRIEEITMTYVVVKRWDERRLVLPITYFLEQPFQNWTRQTSEIMGTIFLYVDYGLPLDELRSHFDSLLGEHPKWDGRVGNIQVTDMKRDYMEVRVLVSSRNSSHNWDLRVELREKLIMFINSRYPDAFVKTRLENETTVSNADFAQAGSMTGS